MIDLGHYKTGDAKTFRCHFIPEKKVAIAMGPLPELAVHFRIDAESGQEAAVKLSGAIGRGVFTSKRP